MKILNRDDINLFKIKQRWFDEIVQSRIAKSLKNNKIINVNEKEHIILSEICKFICERFNLDIDEEPFIKSYIAFKLSEYSLRKKYIYSKIKAVGEKGGKSGIEKKINDELKKLHIEKHVDDVNKYLKQYIIWDNYIERINEGLSYDDIDEFEDEAEKRGYIWDEIKDEEYNRYTKYVNKDEYYKFRILPFLNMFIFTCVSKNEYKGISKSFKHIINYEYENYNVKDIIKFYKQIIKKRDENVSNTFIGFNIVEKEFRSMRISYISEFVSDYKVELSIYDYLDIGVILQMNNIELSKYYIDKYLKFKVSNDDMAKREIIEKALTSRYIIEQIIDRITNNITNVYRIDYKFEEMSKSFIKEYKNISYTSKSNKKIKLSNEIININKFLNNSKTIRIIKASLIDGNNYLNEENIEILLDNLNEAVEMLKRENILNSIN